MRILTTGIAMLTFISSQIPSSSKEIFFRCKQDLTIDTNKAQIDNTPPNILVESINEKIHKNHHFNKVSFYKDPKTNYRFVHAQNTDGAYKIPGEPPTGGNMLMGASATYKTYIRNDSDIHEYILKKSGIECGLPDQKSNNLRKKV